MYKVVLLTTKPEEKRALKAALLEQGYGAVIFPLADVLKDEFSAGKADLLVIDLDHSMVPLHKLCHAVKRDGALKDLPLVLLVPEDQLSKLDYSLGVDDYLTLPISDTRLVERIRFLMWKLNKVEVKNGLKHGDLAIDFERYEVHVDGEPVDLTYKEFELLKFLVTHPGRVFSREALLNKVWGYDYYGGTRTVDVHIRRLRSKIETGGRTYIETVRNVGYKYLPEE